MIIEGGGVSPSLSRRRTGGVGRGLLRPALGPLLWRRLDASGASNRPDAFAAVAADLDQPLLRHALLKRANGKGANPCAATGALADRSAPVSAHGGLDLCLKRVERINFSGGHDAIFARQNLARYCPTHLGQITNVIRPDFDARVSVVTNDLPAETPLSAYEDTLFHIGLIRSKLARLTEVQVDAERQVLHRVGRDFAAGTLSLEDLLDFYRGYRDLVCPAGDDGKRVYITRPGFSDLWNETIPVHSSKIANAVRNDWMRKRYAPNENGTWSGEFPLGLRDQRPPAGQCVVYVLFDDANVPCYVGSTSGFKGRLDGHGREKSFARWVAHPCEDREAAYQMEERLLREHKPYLNKKAGR